MALAPTPAPSNPLLELARLGQSVWIDTIRRDLVERGGLARLIAEDGVSGLTSNPAIFEKAIAQGEEYAAAIVAARARVGDDPRAIYEALAIDDVRGAADLLRPVHERTGGADGFVSLEVAPDLAHDTAATIAEARRLWAAVARPNLMIKVPGTAAGLPAIRALLAEGIHVNVTLLFARSAHAAVAAAHAAALEERLARGLAVDRVDSVASFFVSRIDTLVDAWLEAKIAAAPDAAVRERRRRLCGKIAIANAKLAYRFWREWTASERWRRLAAAGARPQRLLWASTSTKNPAYRETLYVEELAGPDTVNTMPPETIDAFRAQGVVRPALGERVEEAEFALAELAEAGISLAEATDQLLAEGVAKFVQPFEKLLAAVGVRSRALAERSA
jgi:transaldolase